MAEALDLIHSEGLRILELGREDLTRPVPQYPGWTMAGLLEHVGGIVGRTSLVCRDLLTERVSAPRPEEGADIAEWYEDRLNEVLDVFRSADLEAPVWGFTERPVIGTWATRMVVEVGVHRWDAEQAFGEPSPLLDDVAISGLDEYANMWFPRLEGVQALALTATDLARHWHYGDADPGGTVEGTASDLYLRLMSRPSPISLPQDWADAVDGLPPPPR
ncbi:MAG TPA: maleylpyruvate isomerase family mycothiol-dependent enzyme [Acidimicrobiia bacterium]|nr:maleylpyruvate isomerase family mycothiol-dependent enzyme [Acidimicrobiia bacterium]